MSYRTNIEQQNLLNQFLKGYGVQLSEETLGKLYDFADLVVETKQFGNLISAKDSEKFLSRHIADSLVPYIYIVKEMDALAPAELRRDDRWADMGAGAGCPVFPLAIAMPEVQFYAVEPRHMRVEFMNYAKEKLQLKNLTVVGKRFETSGLASISHLENDPAVNIWKYKLPNEEQDYALVTRGNK